MPEVSFVWARPNELNHPRPYFEISLASVNVFLRTSRVVVLTRNLVNLPRFGKLVRMEVLSRL